MEEITTFFQMLGYRLLPGLESREACGRLLRQAVALPLYTVAPILSYASDALGNLAAWIAGDDLAY